MNTKDLIKKLQELVKEHEPHIEVMGEHEIMIDIFGYTEDGKHFEYKGFSPNIIIDRSSDGVYHIINSFELEDNEGTI